MLSLLLSLAIKEQTITFTHPCAHSSVVLEKLGEQMGVKMAPGGSVLQDYFAVKFTDRDAETVKRLLATTLNAVWVQRGEYLVLDRGPAQERAEIDAETAAFRAGIDKFLEANPAKPFDIKRIQDLMLAEMKAPLEDGADFRMASPELQRLLPAHRFAAKIARAIGTAEMAGVTPQAPLRYFLRADGSTNMPPDVKKAVEEYKKESAQVFELGVNLGATIFIGGYGPEVGRQTGYTLSINREDIEIQISIKRERIDLPQGGFRSDGSFIGIMRGVARSAGGKRIEIPMPKGRLELSPEGACMLKVVAGRQGIAEKLDTYTNEEFQRARELAKDFATYEPLALYASVPLAQAMEQAGRDYVAIISDPFAFGSSWLTHAVKGDLAEVWRHLHMTFEEDEATGILKYTAGEGIFGRKYRLDRSAGSKFIAAVDREKRVTLDDLADFTKNVDNRQEFFFWMNAVTKFVPIPRREYGQWQALKVFGNLSPTERAVARSEGVLVDWYTLPKAVQDTVAIELFSTKAAFSDEPVADSARWHSYSLSDFNGANTERFLVPPVPRGTTLRVRVVAENRLKPGVNEYGSHADEVLTTVQFAQRVVQSDEAEFRSAIVVNVERVIVDVFVPGIGYLQLVAQVDSSTEETKYVPLDKLPEPWKSQLAEEIKKLGGGATWTAKQNVNHQRAKR